jgi:Zn-finger nucleic acid-binding protein
VQCPVCSDVQLAISSREGVEIDHCPQCRGVWLDRGELDKILDRVATTTSALPAPPLPPPPLRPEPPRDDRRDDRRRDDDDDDDRYRSKKKRRGSFLEDLFDFD